MAKAKQPTAVGIPMQRREDACDECHRLGYMPCDSGERGLEIQRCDNCGVLVDDDEAIRFASYDLGVWLTGAARMPDDDYMREVALALSMMADLVEPFEIVGDDAPCGVVAMAEGDAGA